MQGSAPPAANPTRVFRRMKSFFGPSGRCSIGDRAGRTPVTVWPTRSIALGIDRSSHYRPIDSVMGDYVNDGVLACSPSRLWEAGWEASSQRGRFGWVVEDFKGQHTGKLGGLDCHFAGSNRPPESMRWRREEMHWLGYRSFRNPGVDDARVIDKKAQREDRKDDRREVKGSSQRAREGRPGSVMTKSRTGRCPNERLWASPGLLWA